MLPYPRGAVTDDTKPHAIFGNQVCFFDCFESLAELGLGLYLMPTEQMHDALTIDEIKPKAFDLAPLPLPPGSPNTLAFLSWATTSSTFGASRRVGAVNTEHHHRAAPFTRCDFRDAFVDLLTRRRDVQHTEPLCNLIGEGMHALTAEMDTGEIVKESLSFAVGGLHHQLGRCLLHIELDASRT